MIPTSNYWLLLVFITISCTNTVEKQNTETPVSKTEPAVAKQIINDSVYKPGDLLFEAKRNAIFELIKKGEQPKLKTNGDTLYSDDEELLLGDFEEMTSRHVYKKFEFKSQFDNFKVNTIHKGRLADPDFSTDAEAKRFMTPIKDWCRDMGINYAGHFTIVELSCGALCQELAIVDRITGKIIFSQIPFDTADGHSGSKYKIDSKMLIINTEPLSEFEGYEPGYRRFDSWRIPAVYVLENNKFRKLE